jgi:hypothetical protein
VVEDRTSAICYCDSAIISHQLELSVTRSVVVAGEQHPANLEGDERVDAGVLDLLDGEPVRVPVTRPHPLRLIHVDAHHDAREGLQSRAAEARAFQLLRGEVAQLHRVGHVQLPVVPELVRVAPDTHAYEAVVGVAEELLQRVGEVVGVDELEDEAAAADAELEDRGGAVGGAEGGAPLHVQPDHELVQAAAVDVEDLVEPVLHGLAGGCHRGLDRVALEHHSVHLSTRHGIASAGGSQRRRFSPAQTTTVRVRGD